MDPKGSVGVSKASDALQTGKTTHDFTRGCIETSYRLPNLPVVVGELGNGGPEARGAMAEFRSAQRAGATQSRFSGTVKFVETAAFARPKEESPCVGHGHHWFANSERVWPEVVNGVSFASCTIRCSEITFT